MLLITYYAQNHAGIIGWSLIITYMVAIRGGENRGARGAMAPLNLRPLHRIAFFAIENQFSLVKQPPLLLVASSASGSYNIATYISGVIGL